MSCGCDTCSCDKDSVEYQDLLAYDKVLLDIIFFYQNKQYSEILERLEREYPVNMAGISKLKISE